jgi:MIP family channel proteins
LVTALTVSLLLVPIAIVLHSKASTVIETDPLLEAPFEDDASISLLQTSATKQLSVASAQISTSHTSLHTTLADAGINIAAAFAEYTAMTLFVTIGCGSAMGLANKEGSAWVLQVALTFGIAITVLAYSIGHISGGQINCAVTFALAINGSLGWGQACVNLVFQLAGSVTGALILSVIYPAEKDLTGNLGSNGVGDGWSKFGALVGEAVGTFVLCFTVLNTAIDVATVANRQIACLAIGLSVFLAHSVLIPIDGCSINPTRSFGPALVSSMRGLKGAKSTFADMWIFWVGPLTGAALAVAVYKALN